MHPFAFYLQLGFEHITDFGGLDHVLFLIALCAVYRLEEWRRLLILVTAFTVGHSITLALASLDGFTIASKIIEFLIPVTILLTAIHNVIGRSVGEAATGMGQAYAMALFFGLIHGMGFSNYFRALLMNDSSIAVPLLGFNLGIELGQLLVVGAIVCIAFLFLNVLRVKQREWNVFVSGAATGLALMLMYENRFW
ncbi:MAG: HupE/UreJ family protein [Pseudomonadota bacterium]